MQTGGGDLWCQCKLVPIPILNILLGAPHLSPNIFSSNLGELEIDLGKKWRGGQASLMAPPLAEDTALACMNRLRNFENTEM